MTDKSDPVYRDVMGADDDPAKALGRQAGKTETTAALLDGALAEQVPVEWLFARLRSPVVLTQRVHDSSQKRGYRTDTARLEPGDEVAIIDIDDDPRNHYPIRCMVRGWSNFFYLGRNVDIVPHLVVKDASGFVVVDPPPVDEPKPAVLSEDWVVDEDMETYGVQ